jgi:uncharacterized protein (TIGR03382 family)
VQITSPAAGATLGGTVQVTASASAGATKVELYVDGALLAAAASASWNTTTAVNGSHSLTAKAYDASGASGTSPAVVVNVSNIATCAGLFVDAACPPPPGCSSTTGGIAAFVALLAAAGLQRRRRRG